MCVIDNCCDREVVDVLLGVRSLTETVTVLLSEWDLLSVGVIVVDWTRECVL